MGSGLFRRRLCVPSVLALAALCVAPVVAAGRDGEGPGAVALEDLIQVVLLDRELMVIDGRGGGRLKKRLEIGEELLYHESQGRVGVAITDRRMLAAGLGSGSWQEARYRDGERPPTRVYLGDRLALILTAKRWLFFDGGSGNLVDEYFGLEERLLGVDVDRNVGVIVTNRRALGFSPFVGGRSEVGVQVQERVEEIEARSNLATVRTNRRLLTFRAPTGGWGETQRNLR